MAIYNVRFIVEGKNVNEVEKRLQEQYPEAEVDVEKIEQDPSRNDRLGHAADLVTSAKEIVDELTEELQSWAENLPENFQAKGEEIDEAVSNLESLSSELENISFDAVEFPSMC